MVQGEAVDDFPAIARILQEGYRFCKRRPAKHFLAALGAEGESYESMVVREMEDTELSSSECVCDAPQQITRPRLPTAALEAFDTTASSTSQISPVAAADCETCKAAAARPSEGSESTFYPAVQCQPAIPRFM